DRIGESRAVLCHGRGRECRHDSRCDHDPRRGRNRKRVPGGSCLQPRARGGARAGRARLESCRRTYPHRRRNRGPCRQSARCRRRSGLGRCGRRATCASGRRAARSPDRVARTRAGQARRNRRRAAGTMGPPARRCARGRGAVLLQEPDRVALIVRRIQAMTHAADLSLFTRCRPDGALEMEVAVEGIACGGCIGRIEAAIKRLPGVLDARVNFTNRRLTTAWRAGEGVPQQVITALEHMGYAAHPFVPRAAETEDAREAKDLMRCLAVAGFAAMNIMLLSVSVWSGNATDITLETRDFFHWVSALIAIPAVAYAGRPFFRSAFGALRAYRVNMDVPISLGVMLAVGMSLVETMNHAEHAYFDSAVMLLFFLLC